MANNPSPNPNPNPSSNPNPKPTPPKYELRVNHHVAPSQSTGTFRLTIRCTVFRGGVPVSGTSVKLEEGVVTHQTEITDANGQVTFIHDGHLKEEEQSLEFAVRLVVNKEEDKRTIIVPPLLKKIPEDNDPEKLILIRHHDGQGNFRLLIRVLKAKGVGLPIQVNVWYRGNLHSVQTDTTGNAAWDVPGTLNPGETHHLTATVSGIADAAKLKISRPRLPLQTVPRFTPQWWIGTNNGRSFVLLLVSIFLLFLSVLIGTGEGVINDMTFRKDSSGLSKQEELYNSIVKEVDPKYQLPVHEHVGVWKNDLRLIALVMILISLIYWVVARREEIAEGFREGIERLSDQSGAQSGDPGFEKLAKWAGIYSAAHSSQKTSEKNDDDGHSFMTIFSSDLLSEAIIKIVPSVFRRVF